MFEPWKQLYRHRRQLPATLSCRSLPFCVLSGGDVIIYLSTEHGVRSYDVRSNLYSDVISNLHQGIGIGIGHRCAHYLIKKRLLNLTLQEADKCNFLLVLTIWTAEKSYDPLLVMLMTAEKCNLPLLSTLQEAEKCNDRYF